MIVFYGLIAVIISLFAELICRGFNRLWHILNDVHTCQIEYRREFKPGVLNSEVQHPAPGNVHRWNRHTRTCNLKRE